MQKMNYGCGSTVNTRDLTNNPKILYVGVGGEMELLQFLFHGAMKLFVPLFSDFKKVNSYIYKFRKKPLKNHRVWSTSSLLATASLV